MVKSGKRHMSAAGKINREHNYALNEAIGLVKDNAKAKFDETVEIALNLGVDPRHSDQMVRGVVSLPNGTGRSVRVAVFAKGDNIKAAKEAGADIAGGDTVTFHQLKRFTMTDNPRSAAGFMS